MATSKKPETVVMVPCPRCGGQGFRDHWHPEQGRCYLCNGKGDLEVNIERGERHLAFLRGQYRKAREIGDTELMEMITQRGANKRALVEAARKVAGR